MVDPDAKTRLSESKPDPLVGRSFDGYVVEEIIGRGGMGTVYKARQLSLGRPVAIKVLTSDLAADRQFLERFHREADVLSRLSHPNIVTVFERGEVDGQPYLVMEYVEGTSLRDLLRKERFAPQEALRIVSSVLSALQHAHEKGIVHRDIKPENVLLARGDIVKVADFGLSRLLDIDQTRLTRTHLVLGTYEYMAPEQREHASEADTRSDLYATGVVLYEMLTGELPIGRFELPSDKRPGECDRRVDDLIERSLDKNPAQRFQAASEMASAVSRILEKPSSPEDAAPRRPRRPAGDGSKAGYRPVRFEYHLDNIATIDHVLGTACYVFGFLALFGAGFVREIGLGVHFILFFVAGWYLRETAEHLGKHKPSARTSQAVIAVIAGFTGILVPFTLYSFWVLFGHRGRTYYDARARGLSPRAAAEYTYRLLEDPYFYAPRPEPARARKAEPAAAPPPPQPPTPSQIPVESMVTSKVEPKPEPPAPERMRVSPFIKAGLWVTVITFIAGGVSIATDQVIDMDDGGVVPLILGCIFLAIGFFHAIFSRKARGATLALVAIGIAIAGGVWYEQEYATPARRAMWNSYRDIRLRVGSYSVLPPHQYEYMFMRDNARTAWIQEATGYPGTLSREVRLRRSGNVLWVQMPREYRGDRNLMNDVAFAVSRFVAKDHPDGFVPSREYKPSPAFETFEQNHPLPE